jgi:hypothetical protein
MGNMTFMDTCPIWVSRLQIEGFGRDTAAPDEYERKMQPRGAPSRTPLRPRRLSKYG